jgi:L-alanine-DL-glutamate epimerase-like enolase superfamily enzyme
MKVGKPDWREDAVRVRAVRDQIGDLILMCDANQRWDLSTASRIMPVLEEAQLDWVEEPQQFTSFIAADALRVIQVDATRVGGVTEWLQVAAHASGRGLRVAPHAGDMMQVHQHLVGTIVSEAPPLIEFIPWTQDAFTERSIVRDGYLHRPQAPGPSTAIDPRARSRWQIRGIGGLRTA